MATNSTNAEQTNKKDLIQVQLTKKVIYIGVFFDGTNNNKFQVTMGKYFRTKANQDSKLKTAKDSLDFGYANSTDKWVVEDSFHSAEIYQTQNNNFSDNTSDDKRYGNGFAIGMPNNNAIINKNENTNESLELYNSIVQAYKKGEIEKVKTGEGAASQGVDTYTNVAILEAIYAPKECPSEDYYPIYIEGAGTDMDLTDNSNISLSRNQGLINGTGSTGVNAKVQKAIIAIRNICFRYTSQSLIESIELHICTYGFSRGATEARMFSFHTRDKNDLCGAYSNKVSSVNLDFVGLFDTVSSVGTDFSDDVDSLNLWGINHAKSVLHLCAMDEFRDNFALTNIENCISSCGTELFMPGCHTDVGGGFSIGLESDRVMIYTREDEIGVNYLAFPHCNYIKSSEYHLMHLYGPRSIIIKLGVDTLHDMGWIDRDNNLNYIDGASDSDIETAGGAYQINNIYSVRKQYTNVEIRKYVKPGYSNIALGLMHSKSTNFFLAIPTAYQLPSDNTLFKRCYEKWAEEIESNGRRLATISNEDYQQLRRNYLHISMTETGFIEGSGVTGNKYVNGPHFKNRKGSTDKLIMRKVFNGVEKGGFTYMDDLNFNG